MQTKNNWLFLKPAKQEGYTLSGGDVSEGEVTHGTETYPEGSKVLYSITPKLYMGLLAIQEKDVMAVL